MNFQLHVAGGVWLFLLLCVVAPVIGHYVGRFLARNNSSSGEGSMTSGLESIMFIVVGIIITLIALVMLFTTTHAAYAALAALFCFGAATGPAAR